MNNYTIGQRWASSNEPELGVGFLLSFDNFTISIFFPSAESHRKYSIDSAPIFRVEYGVGDKIFDINGISHTVTSVVEKNGLLTYICSNKIIEEAELSDKIINSKPIDRLKKGEVDYFSEYKLRVKLLKIREELLGSEARGFIGAKIDLIDHQIFVADKVSKKRKARVLLSDETGLGKTIESALTIHRLLLTNRISRALIVVPDSLIHQWFIELYRKFNLNFNIIDPNNFTNKTLDQNQLFIITFSNLENEEEVIRSIFNSNFDLLVVDEAHHITDKKVRYDIFSYLSSKIERIIFLSATPEQFGNENHFKRLQLLDPIKYSSYPKFIEEQKNYTNLSNFIKRVQTLSPKNYKKEVLKDDFYPKNRDIIDLLLRESKSKKNFIENSLDLFSIGRSIFRNSRKNINGFNKREVKIVPLKCDNNFFEIEGCELFGENSHIYQNSFKSSVETVKIEWLSKLLKKDKKIKYLLICNSKDKAISINKSLKEYINVKSTMFHEDLSLLQRDKNSSYFSDEDGAQILISSEIGSEGRNFQFANNLILFDLPLNPELIEQRIGRLDRIGQKKVINIFIPTIENSIEHNLTLWYHKSMNIFRKNLSGSFQIFNQLKKRLETVILSKPSKKEFNKFIRECKKEVDNLSLLVEKGRDFVLERNSFNKEKAQLIKREIKGLYKTNIKLFSQEIFKYFGVSFEKLEREIYKFDFQLLNNNEFPIGTLKNEYHNFTFDRVTASINENLDFITWDHPIIEETIDLYLLSSIGNSINVMTNLGFEGFALEASYIFESTAPKSLRLNRYINKNLIRVQVDHNLKSLDLNLENYNLQDENPKILASERFRNDILKSMIEKSEDLAEIERLKMIENGIKRVDSMYNQEIEKNLLYERIGVVANGTISRSLKKEKENIIEHLKNCVIRLDSIMLIRSSEKSSI
ncbi:MAG: RNA polymerase-associated protein RapA [Candidatus Cloacimonadota bacterium]|nr:MAG: RNA polymerase-associated protein RapA [Candidatus Cloacimonadota bacterium]PIE79950.1 MAG: RNA polymerase-associated protein RapA [Candidatus Delongbacteria bacterium]